MAIVVESSAKSDPYTPATNPAVASITKPSGTVSGDFLIATIFDSSGGAATPPSGFTLIRATSAGGFTLYSYYKLAGGSEPASYDFSYAANGSASGVMLRTSGSAGVIQTSAGEGFTNQDPMTFTGVSVTPTYANSLLIVPIYQYSSSVNDPHPSVTSIAVSNPTWVLAQQSSSGLANGFSTSTAVRPQTTATGDLVCDMAGDNTADAIAQMIVLTDITNATPTPAVVGVTVNIQAPTVQQGQTVTIASPVSVTVGIQNPSIDTKPTISNQSKNSSSWTNLDKS